MKTKIFTMITIATLSQISVFALSDTIIEQKKMLEKNTQGQGFGPQSPRNIDLVAGNNKIQFNNAAHYSNMNLCNIHFHKNAEHKGGEFTSYAGDGDKKGFGTGYKYTGVLNEKELTQIQGGVCVDKDNSLNAGDTIELHYVHSSAKIKPGPTLGACLSESIINPQLRVETQVFVLVNDKKALDFEDLTKSGMINGYQQALNIPNNTGKPIQYSGSTTGPSFNEQGSPLQVTWNVRPKVAKVNISTVANWCKGNIYKEGHAQGVRNLVENLNLLSEIK
jgi:hypothetical protein